MKPWLVGCTIAILFLLALGAGCAGKPGVTTPTPTPTLTPSTIQTTERTPVITVPTTVNPIEPQPTDFVPNGWTTSLTVSRKPSSYQPDIIVIYNGGTGQGALQQLEVIVTHPDGSVQTETVTRPENGSISTQTTVVIPQTVNEQVRVQVKAMYGGIVYSVYDQVVPPA
jgi:hypothetical protein